MRTLHPAYRITDLATSLAFYGAIGFEQVGRVDLGDGVTLTMLKFPADEVVTLELVHRPADGPVVIGSGFSHLAVQVDDLSGMIEALAKAGLSAGQVERPGGLDGHKRHGCVTPTATGSNWCSGHPVTPMGSPLPTLARRPVPSARLGSGYRSRTRKGPLLSATGSRGSCRVAGPTGPQSQAKKQSWGAAAPRLRFRSNLIKAGSQDQTVPQMPILPALSRPRHRQYRVARDFHVLR